MAFIKPINAKTKHDQISENLPIDELSQVENLFFNLILSLSGENQSNQQQNAYTNSQSKTQSHFISGKINIE